MGINVQDVLAQDPELLQRQLYQQEMQRLNPQGDAAGAIGALLGRGLGNVTRGRGFFDVADPALQKVAKIKQLQTAALQDAQGDPVKTLEALSKSLMQDPELAPFAMQVQEQLIKIRPKTGGKISLSVADLERIDPAQRAQVIANYQATGQLPSDISLVGKPEDVKKDITFYKANPEQATFRLQEIVTLLEADPNNKTLLKEYEQITAAASEGARENYNKEQKRILDTKLDNVRLAQYNQQLNDASKLSSGERWDREIEAARDLLKIYNIDMSKPLKNQIPSTMLYSSIGATLTQAYQKAVKQKLKEGGKPVDTSSPKQLNEQDQQALNWANANPKDPRAAQIKQRLGVK
jgi:hypothetical protein